ncbi:hypothetical protein RRG08_061131 [Elysia crispata]|uniref:Uncharacterized protein n=1 Tax=Elysia crispata TaxID=231223 RepID=A0AAE1CED4_9GAST|nr:hypothetical protein RRG08_061131 [Elysia crispata]
MKRANRLACNSVVGQDVTPEGCRWLIPSKSVRLSVLFSVILVKPNRSASATVQCRVLPSVDVTGRHNPRAQEALKAQKLLARQLYTQALADRAHLFLIGGRGESVLRGPLNRWLTYFVQRREE